MKLKLREISKDDLKVFTGGGQPQEPEYDEDPWGDENDQEKSFGTANMAELDKAKKMLTSLIENVDMLEKTGIKSQLAALKKQLEEV